MSAQKKSTQNKDSAAVRAVGESRQNAVQTGGTLAEAVLKFVDARVEQMRQEDIQRLDCKTDGNEKEIGNLRTAHAGLSRKQGELETRQKTTDSALQKLNAREQEDVDALRERIKGVSEGLSTARKKGEQNAAEIKKTSGSLSELGKKVDGKLDEAEVNQMIADALETNNTFVLDQVGNHFVSKEDAEDFARKGDVQEVRDGYVTMRDSVDEAVRKADDAYTVAVDAEAKASGAFDHANGAADKISEIDSDVHEIRTSMAPQPAKEIPEVPEEAMSAPGTVTVTKAEVENMIKHAVKKTAAYIMGRVADVAEFVDSPKEMADALREEIDEVIGNDSGDE